jgi:hypothetical protein
MSFFYTTEQIRNRTKTVTRRVGWKDLVPGDRIKAVVKCQGLKRGEKTEPLAEIEIISIRSEPLYAITAEDCAAEGFPEMGPDDFVAMFCDHMMHRPDWPVNRIEFRYV